jgi:hypothetical protein
LNITFTEHSCSGNIIQKIELGELENIDEKYCANLFSLINLTCRSHGFVPDIDVQGLMHQLQGFISKAINRIICVIIDKTGLFLKDLNGANQYISRYTTFGNAKGPILGVIG